MRHQPYELIYRYNYSLKFTTTAVPVIQSPSSKSSPFKSKSKSKSSRFKSKSKSKSLAFESKSSPSPQEIGLESDLSPSPGLESYNSDHHPDLNVTHFWSPWWQCILTIESQQLLNISHIHGITVQASGVNRSCNSDEQCDLTVTTWYPHMPHT